MSQAIKKLQEGGSVTQIEQNPKEQPKKVKTFSLGDREIETSSLLKDADTGVESYLESTGWSAKKKNAFRDSYSKYLTSINSGAIASRDVGRNWIDTTGQLVNASDKGFDANGAVVNYLDSVADAIPEYTKIEPSQAQTTKQTFNFGAGLNKSLLNKFFGGNQYNKAIWESRDPLDETTKNRGFSNRLKDFSTQFGEYSDSLLNDPEFSSKYDLSNTAFKNRDELKSRIDNAKAILSDGKLEDSDWRSLAELGINVDTYRDWFQNTASPENTETEKPDNFKGKKVDVAKANSRLTDAGFMARTDDKGNIFYLNPDGTELSNGVINSSFNPTMDSLAGWFKVNGNLYDPKDYKTWSPEIRDAYNVVLNEQDDRIIHDDPIYSKIKNKYGLTHVADASSFFGGYKGQIVQAYTRPTEKDPTGGKSQYFVRKGDDFSPVSLSYNDILGEWTMNDKGTTTRLGKARQPGTKYIEGKNDTVGLNRIRQYSLSGKDMYTSENVQGLLRRLGDNPSLANEARYRGFIQGLFLPGRLDSLQNADGTPLSKLVKEGRIDYSLVPNSRKRGLRIIRDKDGKVTRLSFNTESEDAVPAYTPGRAEKIRNYAEKKKEGGIIKAQWGVKSDFVVDDVKPIESLSKEEGKINKKATDSYDKTQSISFNNKDITDAGGIIKTSDKVKMGAAMTDLLSAGLGFIPGANIASAGIGAASSLAEFGADVSDGFEMGDVGNLALNLGMDAISLVPAMKSIKAAKAMKSLIKYVPAISTAIGAAVLFNDQERDSLIGSLKKLSSGNLSDLSTDDFKNFATISRVVLSGKNTVKAMDNKLVNRVRGTKTGPSTKKEIAVEVTGRSTPVKVQVNNSEIEGKDANFIQELAKKKAKKQLSSEGLQESKITDDMLSVQTTGTDKWYKGKFFRPKTVVSEKVAGVKSSNPNWFQRNVIPQPISDTPKNFGEFWGMRGINPNSKLGILSDSYWGNRTPRVTGNNPSTPTPKGETKMIGSTPNAEIRGKLLTPSERRTRLQGKGLSEEELNRKGIYKDGGIIKAQAGRAITNVKSTANWGSDIYGTDNFNNWLSNYNVKNYKDFNNLQSSYATNLSSTGYKPFTSPVQYNQGVYNRQETFNTAAPGVNSLIEGLSTSGKIVRAGNSGDDKVGNFRDGYFGGQEFLRHGGNKPNLNPERLKSLNALANKNGLEYYLDEATGMGMLRPVGLQTPIAPQFNTPAIDSSKVTIDPNTGKVAGVPTIASPSKNPTGTRGTTTNPGLRQILGNLDPTSFIQAGRVAGNIWNNERVARKTKEGLKPFLQDTYETPRQVVGDLGTRQAYNNRAADLESLAARPRTSDGSLQLAGQLQANSQANQMRAEGDLVDNDMIRRTGEAAWQNTAEAVARRSEVSNRNRASMLGIEKAKSDIDAAKISANWTSLENFMKEREYQSTINRDRQRQFDINTGMQTIQDNTERRLAPLRKFLEDKSAAGIDISTLPQYNQYIRLSETLGKGNSKLQNELFAKVHGLKYRKSGGRLTLGEEIRLENHKESLKAKTENAKLFQKNIEKTVDNNIKMIDNLSSVTKQLIIKSMT